MNTHRISLKDAPPGRYKIVEIMPEALESVSLKDIPLAPGDTIEVLFSSRWQIPTGPLVIVVADKQIILGRGMAQTVRVQLREETLFLNELFPGESGTIAEILGGRSVIELFKALGVSPGQNVTVKRFLSDDALYFQTDGNDVVLGAGEASKILVRIDGRIMQVNFLEPGQSATIANVIGGDLVLADLSKKGITPGKIITFLRKTHSEVLPLYYQKYVGIIYKGKEIYLCEPTAAGIFVGTAK